MPYFEALYKFVHGRMSTIDIREDSRALIKEDYLDITDPLPKPEIIIGNPPFTLALDFIKKALEDVEYGGYVIMLCRLNYFGAQYRKKFWDKYMPLYVYVHSKRMSFSDDGKTDSNEYAHFVWQKGNYPEFTKLKVI
jgi:hypothetical protein